MTEHQTFLMKTPKKDDKQITWISLKSFKIINGKKVYLITSAIGKLE